MTGANTPKRLVPFTVGELIAQAESFIAEKEEELGYLEADQQQEDTARIQEPLQAALDYIEDTYGNKSAKRVQEGTLKFLREKKDQEKNPLSRLWLTLIIADISSSTPASERAEWLRWEETHSHFQERYNREMAEFDQAYLHEKNPLRKIWLMEVHLFRGIGFAILGNRAQGYAGEYDRFCGGLGGGDNPQRVYFSFVGNTQAHIQTLAEKRVDDLASSRGTALWQLETAKLVHAKLSRFNDHAREVRMPLKLEPHEWMPHLI
ncbi:MAG: hypothetical protein GC136_09650 [Alphaproteobacteria bacterium]|nr:hypothetical protein [Alphaproteobacteria bacterium]